MVSVFREGNFLMVKIGVFIEESSRFVGDVIMGQSRYTAGEISRAITLLSHEKEFPQLVVRVIRSRRLQQMV